MTLRTRLQRVLLELEDIRDECRYTSEKAALDLAIKMIADISLYSDVTND